MPEWPYFLDGWTVLRRLVILVQLLDDPFLAGN